MGMQAQASGADRVANAPHEMHALDTSSIRGNAGCYAPTSALATMPKAFSEFGAFMTLGHGTFAALKPAANRAQKLAMQTGCSVAQMHGGIDGLADHGGIGDKGKAAFGHHGPRRRLHHIARPAQGPQKPADSGALPDGQGRD